MQKQLQGDWNAADFKTYGASAIIMPGEFFDLIEQQISNDEWHIIDEPNAVSYPVWFTEYLNHKRAPYGHKYVPTAYRLAAQTAVEFLEPIVGLVQVADVAMWRGTGDMPWHTDDKVPSKLDVQWQLLSYIGEQHSPETGGAVLFKAGDIEAAHYPGHRTAVLHSCEPGYLHRTIAHTGRKLDRLLFNIALSKL